MTNELLHFLDGFNQLIKYTSSPKKEGAINFTADSMEQLYFNICDLLSELGYSVLSRNIYEELFELHLEDSSRNHNSSRESLMLTFFLQLANIDIYKPENIINYSLNCDNHMLVYDLLYANREYEIRNPKSKNSSFIYEQRSLLNILISNDIIHVKS